MVAWKGRLPDPTNPDEAAISYMAATLYHVHVGDVLTVHLPTLQDVQRVFSGGEERFSGGSALVKITAIELSPGEIPPGIGFPPIHLTPAFFRALGPRTVNFPLLMFRLRSEDQLAGFLADVQAHALQPGGPSNKVQLLDFIGVKHAIQRAAHVQAIALWVLAILAGVSGVLILSQTIVRQALIDSADSPTLSALGIEGSQLFAISLVRLAMTAVAGAALAVAFAFAASPLAPIGLSRLAESAPGLFVDPLLLVGAGGIVALVLLIGILPAYRAARAVGRRTREWSAHPSHATELLAHGGASPSMVSGVRFALEPGRGRSAVPVRSTIAGAAIGVAAVIMALGFGSSLTHLLHTPRLTGWDVTGTIGDDFDPEDAARVIPFLKAQKDLSDVSAGGEGQVSLNEQSVRTFALDQVEGNYAPVMLSGRAPVRRDEIALGARTMRALHVNVGSVITAAGSGGRIQMSVVGMIVAPAGAGGDAVGIGSYMTFQGLRSIEPKIAEDVYVFRLRPGVLLDTFIQRLKLRFPINPSLQTKPFPTDVSDLGQVRNFPLVLAGALAFLGAASLAHLLGSSIRRRRTDLAILKTLGFVRRQVRLTVAWQATTLAIVALAIGLPLGYGASRWMWGLFANTFGFVSEPVLPVAVIALAIPVLIVAANAIAVLPARAAARLRLAEVLRAE
jgi:hypothetical protein